ncbi:ABC transporter permease [Campylobacter sp. MIT 99-7217]|uniref:ABC transporter permease n=1 Tax=Campylobacter sp. MIT 99-7217 TaxID=535091 RepID=UPI00115AC3CA|nr:ABC transporter permease [Campylobacter sp. MIT 99-7217]TQR32417.1 ABC transporter permease [Campylobacter sp. MIT 99-7217]
MKISLSLAALSLCFLYALAVPLFSDNANLINLEAINLAPSLEHFFGTDSLGRDLFTRLALALRISFLVGFVSSFLALFIAIFYVFLARLYFYNFFMRILDAFLAFPTLLLVMFFQSFFEGNLSTMIIILALTHWCIIAKSLDSELKRLSKSDFYLCAIALGSTKFKALLKELMPASFSLILILFILNIAHAISNEATLSFFNLGVKLGEASLGTLLNEASKAFFTGSWWQIIFPLLALLMLIMPLLSLANLAQKGLAFDRG